jgi:hypothetical protein
MPRWAVADLGDQSAAKDGRAECAKKARLLGRARPEVGPVSGLEEDVVLFDLPHCVVRKVHRKIIAGEVQGAISNASRQRAPDDRPACCAGSKRLRKLGYQLGPFWLGPGARGVGAHVSQRTDRKREFGDIVSLRRFGDDEDVVLARREINLLDVDADFFGERSRRFGATGSLLDRTNSLVGLVDRQYECRHVVLHGLHEPIACRGRGRPTCSKLKLRGRHKRSALLSDYRCLPTARSLPVLSSGDVGSSHLKWAAHHTLRDVTCRWKGLELLSRTEHGCASSWRAR